jgi:Trk K+ transport system NAD-binding subunit
VVRDMSAPRPLTEKALREAAQVAAETGSTVVIERGGTVYKIIPPTQPETINPADLITP